MFGAAIAALLAYIAKYLADQEILAPQDVVSWGLIIVILLLVGGMCWVTMEPLLRSLLDRDAVRYLDLRYDLQQILIFGGCEEPAAEKKGSEGESHVR